VLNSFLSDDRITIPDRVWQNKSRSGHFRTGQR